MKVIIAGSRTITDDTPVFQGLIEGLREWGSPILTEIVAGGARGVDTTARVLAERFDIAYKEFPADWDKYGKKAGYLRNVQMADYADALVLVWDGKSRGSKMMKDIAEKRGMPVYEVVV